MKTAGIILLVLGIVMIVIKQFSFTTEKKVVDLGNVELNKQEEKTVAWPTYTGIGLSVLGIALILADRKKK